MDIEIKKKKYLVPRKYWPWIGGGVIVIALLVWLAQSNFTSSLQVDERGLSIATVENAQFNDYVSVDGNVVPIQVVQISPEEGGTVVEKVVDEGSKVHKGDVIVRLSNSNLDLEILNAESELAEKQDMLRNTQLSMEQEQLNNRTEAAQLAMDVQTKKRALSHQTALQKEQLNSREDYLKAKEDYRLAVEKNSLIRQRLSKSAQMRRAQMNQMSDNLASMQRNVELVRQRKAKLDVRSSIDGEVGLLDVELGQSITPGQKIGVINDLSDYKVEAQVDEHYIDRVHSGLAATFTQNGRTYRLEVRKVYPDASRSTLSSVAPAHRTSARGRPTTSTCSSASRRRPSSSPRVRSTAPPAAHGSSCSMPPAIKPIAATYASDGRTRSTMRCWKGWSPASASS